jgi:antitoxin component of MazEF toxin-antitoxin module
MAIEYLGKITPCGNSFMIIIPKRYVFALGVKPKDYVIVKLTQGTLVVRPYERNEQCRVT